MLAVLAALVIYNIVIVLEPSPHDTVSALLFDWGRRYPTVPLVTGILCGHWFWPPRHHVPAFGPWALLVWGTIFAGLDWFNVIPEMPAALPLVTGFALGGWLWGYEKGEGT